MESCCTVQGETTGGRHVVATTNLACGTIVLREAPALVAPPRVDIDFPYCVHCLRPRREPSDPSMSRWARIKCAVCGDDEMAFCSEQCAIEREPLHRLECAKIGPLLELLFQIGDGIPLHKALLLLRVFVGLGSIELHSSLAFLERLQHHASEEHNPAQAALEQKLANFLSLSVPSFTYTSGENAPSAVRAYLSKLDTNAFSCRAGGETAGGAMFRIASFFNHSCCPNAVATWDAHSGEMVITAMELISAGQEITISYVGHCCTSQTCACKEASSTKESGNAVDVAHPHWPRIECRERREFLLATKHFLCQCPRCMREAAG